MKILKGEFHEGDTVEIGGQDSRITFRRAESAKP
jgi:hypothetical protein